MTLGDLFSFLTDHPEILVWFFGSLPLLAGLTGWIVGEDRHQPPWSWWFSGLLYAAVVPGMFAIILNLYRWLFERQPVMETNLLTQILPVLSMVVTLYILHQFVPLRSVRGYGRIMGFIMMVSTVLILMWVLDRTRILVLTWLPFYYAFIILVLLLIVFRIGWKRMAGGR